MQTQYKKYLRSIQLLKATANQMLKAILKTFISEIKNEDIRRIVDKHPVYDQSRFKFHCRLLVRIRGIRILISYNTISVEAVLQ